MESQSEKMNPVNVTREHSSLHGDRVWASVILSAGDRLFMHRLYPTETSIQVAVVVDDLRTKIRFDQDELMAYNIRTEKAESGNVQVWTETDGGVEFGLTKLEVKLLKEQLEELSVARKIGTDIHFIALCRKVMNLKSVEVDED